MSRLRAAAFALFTCGVAFHGLAAAKDARAADAPSAVEPASESPAADSISGAADDSGADAGGAIAGPLAEPGTSGRPGSPAGPGARPHAWIDAERMASAARPAGEVGSWLAHGRTWSEQRFSPLARIDEANVSRLGLAWSYSTGTKRGLEATPIVVDGVLYATANWSIVFALDAKTGRELWRYDPQVQRAKARDACCDVVNRGVAVWKGRVYVGVLDGRLIALDARTGALVWQVQTTDPTQAYTITGAPRVVKDLVVIGNGGAEIGVRGYFSAYDAATGAMRWRFYTVPGPPGTPHEHPELALAATTWSKDSAWEYGLGGTVWDSFAYDPDLDLLYVGVGNSSPYERELRSPGGGDNLFLASILAVRPETGRLVWHYQTTPGENWDYTATQHMILAELRLRGDGGETLRKVLMQAPKNGFFYVLDRATGELLSADAYVPTSWASHVDLETGRPVETGGGEWKDETVFVTPGPRGGHNWHPMAFHPGTGHVYIPTIQMAYPYHVDRNPRFVPHRYNTGEDFPALQASLDGFERALRFCDPTHLTAWDPVRRRQVWRVPHQSMFVGGVLATAGNLVFQGTGGRLAAYRATDGAELWASPTKLPVMAAPISYAIDGDQYIAVLAGGGGAAGLNFEMFEYENPGHVLVYKLDGKAPLPEIARLVRPAPDPPPLRATPETIERGRELYNDFCWRCHGIGTQSGGMLPDLKRSSREVHAQWRGIVLGGLRQSKGMASFADSLDGGQVDAIQAYVIAQALREPTLFESAGGWLAQRLCIPASWIVD